MAQEILDIPTSWLILPAPWPVDSPPTPEEQRWQLTLSGIVDVNFASINPNTWQHETFKLFLAHDSPLSWAFRFEQPQGSRLAFQAEQFVQQASVSSVSSTFIDNPTTSIGHAVDSCEPILISATNMNRESASNYFNGLEVVVGAKGMNTRIHKIAFRVTLIGRIVPVISVL